MSSRPPERILTADVSTWNLGWAATVEPGRPPATGIYGLAGPKAPLHLLYAQVRNSIEELIDEYRPDELAYVPALVGGAGQSYTKALNGVEAMMIIAAFDKGVSIKPVKETDARGAILGRKQFGKRDARGRLIRGTGTEQAKAAALAWCDDRGWDHLDSDDVADSIVLWAYRQRALRLPLAGD